jgi:hypothetical protein
MKTEMQNATQGGLMETTWQKDMQRLMACDRNSMWQNGKMQPSRNSTLTVFNHKEIACTELGLGDNWNVIQLTVLNVEDAGFSKAPFSKTLSKAKLAGSKPLAQMQGDSLRLYSFEKAPMSKGDRLDDVCGCIEPGDVFAIFMDTAKFKQMMATADKSQHLLPTDGAECIPAFSLLQMTVCSKNGENCKKGSIVNIQSIRPYEGKQSLHSCFPMMLKLQGSLNDSLVRANDKAQMYPNMSRDLIRDNVSFFREQCNPMASVELVEINNNSFVRVMEWSNDPTENLAHVDMPLLDVFRLTNSSDVEHALNFLTIAFAMQAVSLLIVHNEFWGRRDGSSMRGVPIVSWQKILQSIDVSIDCNIQNKSSYRTNENYDDGDGPQMIMLNIDSMQTEVVSEEPVTAVDFPIVFPDMCVKQGYNCTISLAENADLSSPRSAVEHIVRFMIDTSCTHQQFATRNMKRRKLTPFM